MRAWVGAVATGVVAAAIWACSDDETNGGSGTTDAGVDAGPYVPPAPPVPLACSVVGTFDPCDAGIDPSVFLADDAGVDASAPSDAGLVPSTSCVASGAVRVACANDAGVVRFDLAASADGTSLAVAASEDPASRFTIASDGGVSAMSALPSGYEDVRIVAGGPTVATVHADHGTTRFLVLRDNVPKDSGFSALGTRLEDPALFGAVADNEGTIHTLLDTSLGYQELATTQQVFDAKLVAGHGTALAWSPGGLVFMGLEAEGFGLYRNGSSSEERFRTDGSAFAVGVGANGEVLLATTGPNEDDLAILAARTRTSSDFMRMRIRREPHCGLDVPGCGSTCTESLRTIAGATGSFVVTSTGTSYFVYPEAHLTRTRTTQVDHDPECDLLGGCTCASTAVVKSFDALDVVAMEVDIAGARLIERARARVVMNDPQTALLSKHAGAARGLVATANGTQIHVAIQGAPAMPPTTAAAEMARVVLDLAK